jgi:hypothetical protein
MAQPASIVTSRCLASGYADDSGCFLSSADPSEQEADSCGHDPSIIDLDGVLEQCAGHDTDFLAELLFDLRREVHAQLNKIIDMVSLLRQDDANCENFGRVERAAQSIKDATFDMLCSSMHKAAQALELQAKEKNLKGCVESYENLQLASNILFEVLDSLDLSAWNNSCSEQASQIPFLF